MTAHDHRTYIEGCFRCDLSRDEVVSTPFEVMTDALLERWHADDDPDQDPFIQEAEDEAQKVLDALAAAGFQVVADNKGEAPSCHRGPRNDDCGDRRIGDCSTGCRSCCLARRGGRP